MNAQEIANKLKEELPQLVQPSSIDKAFEMGNIEGLTKEQLKNYIKARANEKMVELGYKAIYNDIDPNLLKQIEWFGHLTSGKTHQDFFAGRVTSYSKSTADWDDL